MLCLELKGLINTTNLKHLLQQSLLHQTLTSRHLQYAFPPQILPGHGHILKALHVVFYVTEPTDQSKYI